MSDKEDIKRNVKEFILREFLPDEDPDELSDTTSLFSSGILDSIATLKLVSHIEEQFGVSVEPHEVNEENLDDLTLIVRLVDSKL